jgi:hypothetical protein
VRRITTSASQAKTAFREFISHAAFPCLGAKASFNSGSETVRVFDELGSAQCSKALANALYDFTHAPKSSTEYATFVAIFQAPRNVTEIEFESLLWNQLRLLHELDSPHPNWDPSVSADPAAPHFSFSFAGRALYVIGLHANSSRDARRFPWLTLVFNPHEQFQRLRADGKWQRMKETIRQRDLELQGTINPMLSDFGEQSEARQYSGRAVDEDWAPFPAASGKCPFAH